MMIPHVVSTQADKVFVNILNNQSVALSDGDAVVWNTTTPDGVRTKQAAANTVSLFVGLAVGAIAASGYGLAQCYGYNSGALVTADTSVAIDAGDHLVPTASADSLSVTATTGGTGGGFAYAAEAYATDSTPVTASKKVFLRAM